MTYTYSGLPRQMSAGGARCRFAARTASRPVRAAPDALREPGPSTEVCGACFQAFYASSRKDLSPAITHKEGARQCSRLPRDLL